MEVAGNVTDAERQSIVDSLNVDYAMPSDAPDLLAACKSVLDSVPFASYRGDGELEECEGRLRFAILKAEGGVK